MAKEAKHIQVDVKIGRYSVTLTHIDKILLQPNITKAGILHYYAEIADRMVPYMKNRPLMMDRYPEGYKGESFYQKEAAAYFPDFIKRVTVPKKDGVTNFAVCQNDATLVYLANQDTITFHLWLSRMDKLHFPDRLIFDLDPSGKDFGDVRFIALALKELLDHVGLTAFVMTTGSRGLHVIVPLDRKLEFSAVRAFAESCAQHIIEAFPTKATLEIRKEKRGNKIFIDTLRNQFGATAVSPFSVRAKSGAPVATPLHWHEVEDPKLTPTKYTIDNIMERLKKIDDPWEGLLHTRQSLKSAIKKLG